MDRLYLGSGLGWVRGGVPTISSFTVTPARLNRSQFSQYAHVTLAWAASGGDRLGLYETTAAGARTPIPLVSGSRSVTWRRPSSSVVFALEVSNAAGEAVAHAPFAVVANAAIGYFRERAGSFRQSPLPDGGVIGNVMLEWQVSGEPFPHVALSGAGSASFDSSTGSGRDHTDHADGQGNIRLARGLSPQVTPVTYTLRAWNEVNSVTAQATIRWPQGA